MSILQSGNKFSLADISSTYGKLPVGVYMLNYDGREGYFLTRKDGFKLPQKIYGDVSYIDRWLFSFRNNSEKNMGVLLTGLKGSGKTITAQKLCIQSEMPTILINDGFIGQEFINFMTNPDLGNYICFIDKFEKVYPKDNDKKDFLSLMDGNYQTHNIFLITSNKKIENVYLNNRLGRIKYKNEYFSLDASLVDEVIDDILENKNHKGSIYEVFKITKIRTFDLLVNLIKEMNLFKQDALECFKYMNLSSDEVLYKITEFLDGESIPCSSHSINIYEVMSSPYNCIELARKRPYNDERYSEVYISEDTIVYLKDNDFEVTHGNSRFLFEEIK